MPYCTATKPPSYQYSPSIPASVLPRPGGEGAPTASGRAHELGAERSNGAALFGMREVSRTEMRIGHVEDAAGVAGFTGLAAKRRDRLFARVFDRVGDEHVLRRKVRVKATVREAGALHDVGDGHVRDAVGRALPGESPVDYASLVAMSGDLIEKLRADIGGAYRILYEVGGGGMSRIFLARETMLARWVVLKMLPPDLTTRVSVARFFREIQLAAGLQHPHIVPVLSAGKRATFFTTRCR